MIRLVEQNRAAVEALCKRSGVARLELFGSAATDSFDGDHSDVDFLVEFQPDYDLGPWLARYFDFKRDLEQLLGRPVDLVMAGARSLNNPYFAREVNRTRQLLYAA